MAASITKVIEGLAAKLSPETTLAPGWDAKLPEYCSIALASKRFLIVAAFEDGHLVSLIEDGRVKSVVLRADSHEISLDSLAADLSYGDEPRSLPRRAANLSNTAEERHSNSNPLSAQSVGANSRDPNVPPGFENELQSRRPAEPGRFLFDPSSDLYPPGGRFPSLSPMGGSVGGMGAAPAPGPGSGMSPEPFGANKPPFIRYDPTAPGDQSPFGGFPGGNFGGFT